MDAFPLSLAGLLLLTPRLFEDERGVFFESYNEPVYAEHGIPRPVQVNISSSKKGTIRALHYQKSPGQAKLVTCLQGEIWDVAVDIRTSSPTFGKWEAILLDGKKRQQLFIPVGFAHGFCVLSEEALVQYKVNNVYNPATECAIRWNDPDIGVTWPVENPVLSLRDQKSPFFKEVFGEKALGYR